MAEAEFSPIPWIPKIKFDCRVKLLHSRVSERGSWKQILEQHELPIVILIGLSPRCVIHHLLCIPKKKKFNLVSLRLVRMFTSNFESP